MWLYEGMDQPTELVLQLVAVRIATTHHHSLGLPLATSTVGGSAVGADAWKQQDQAASTAADRRRG